MLPGSRLSDPRVRLVRPSAKRIQMMRGKGQGEPHISLAWWGRGHNPTPSPLLKDAPLNPFQKTDRLQVVGLRKDVDDTRSGQAVARCNQALEVAREG